MRCISCGYDLLGLDASGKCPECGDAIARSLGLVPLESIDTRTLRHMLLGIRLIWVSIVAALPLLIVSGRALGAAALERSLLGALIFTGPSVGYGIGWTLLAAQRRLLGIHATGKRSRRLVRWLGIAIPVLLLATHTSAAWSIRIMVGAAPGGLFGVFLPVVFAGLLLITLGVHFVACMNCVEALGVQFGDRSLASRAGWLSGLVPGLCLCAPLLVEASVAAAAIDQSDFGIALIFVALPLAIACVSLVVLLFPLHGRLRRAITVQSLA